MKLATHAKSDYLNITNSCSRARLHIFISEEVQIPQFNGAILTISIIIKFVMPLSADDELVDLFIAAKLIVNLRQTLIDMGWPQPPTPLQNDNSTVAVFSNNTRFLKITNSMDMMFHWIKC